MRPAPSRGEAIAQMGARRYHEHYVGPQFEYERERVEMLLCAYWNGGAVDSRWHDKELDETDLTLDGYIEHLGEVNRAGKDKVQAHARKAYVDPAEQNNWPAYRIDLDRALSRLDRTAVLTLELHYGWGWTQSQIAHATHGVQQRISERIDAAVSTLTRLMNGEQ